MCKVPQLSQNQSCWMNITCWNNGDGPEQHNLSLLYEYGYQFDYYNGRFWIAVNYCWNGEMWELITTIITGGEQKHNGEC